MNDELHQALEVIESQGRRLSEAETECNDLRAELIGIKASLSWKITSPLRVFSDSFKRVLIKILQRLRFYDFLKRHEPFFRQLYGFARKRPALLTNTLHDSTTASASGINSPLVEALIVARSLDYNMDEQSLVDFYELGAGLHMAICVQLDKSAIAALYMLSRAGVKITCIGCQLDSREMQSYGFTFYQGSLDEWMTKNGHETFVDYDCIMLNLKRAEEIVDALKGRVFSNTKVLVSGQTEKDQMIGSGMELACAIGSFELYNSTCEGWLNPGRES